MLDPLTNLVSIDFYDIAGCDPVHGPRGDLGWGLLMVLPGDE